MRDLVSTSGPVSARRLVLTSGLVVMIMVFSPFVFVFGVVPFL